MTSPSEPPLELLGVTCPTCHERMRVELDDRPQTVNCPFCEVRISIPSRETARQIRELERPATLPKVEEYKIASDLPADTGTDTPASGPKRSKRESPATIVVECPTCHERIQVLPKEEPGRIPCTYCGTSVPIPARARVKTWKAAPIKPGDKAAIGEYEAGPTQVAPKVHTHLFDRLAEIRTEVTDPPPRWTFFSGVFQFPWSRGVLPRWGWMALGYTAPLIILQGVAYLTSAAGGGGIGNIAVVAIGFLMLPLIWIGLLTLSYSADCFLRVVESTAYGNDRVVEWTEGTWREWMPSLIYVAWVGAVPIVVSCGIAQAAGFRRIEFLVGAALIQFYLYPIALMSALEANSVWVPITGQVVQSLWRVGWGWLLFYGIVSVMAVGLLVLANFGIPAAGFPTLVALGLLFPAALLIYARLLGRLAWRINRKFST